VTCVVEIVLQHYMFCGIPCIAITDIRLVNGTYKNQGRLEVKVSGIWGTACLNSWGTDESNVACKQLGYSEALFVSGETVSNDEIPNWLEIVHCEGNESFIWDCTNNGLGEDDCIGDDVVYLVCHTEGTEVDVQ